jgi:DNA-binding NarL/FixJ family response regulator
MNVTLCSGEDAMAIRVLLVDSSAWIREGIKAVLAGDEDIEIVGEADDGEKGLELAAALRPNVVVIDVVPEGERGIQSIRSMKERCPGVNVLLFTSRPSLDLFQKAAAAGALGCVEKEILPAELAEAIRNIHNGKAVLHPTLAREVLEGLATKNGAPRVHGLKDREIDIIREIARGMSDKEIAAKLYVSESTVKNHLRAVYYKLKIRNRAQAAAFVIKNDLL